MRAARPPYARGEAPSARGRARRAARPRQRSARSSAGVAQIEGYLLCQATLSTAQAEAEAFADRLDWLTAAQREDVVHHYRQARVAVGHDTIRAVAARAKELAAQYAERYEELRRRLWCQCIAVTLCLTATASWVSATLAVRP